MSEAIQAAAAPQAVGRYPHARRVGNTLYLSGIGPRDARDNSIPADFVAQCHSAFGNVRAVLEASGAKWEDLVDVTVYLTDMANDFPKYNAVWAEYFPDVAGAPCRTTLGITALPTPIAIELKCIAVLPGSDQERER